MLSKIQVELSSDGSTTLFRPDLNEHYHSVHGAIQEALHVFIEPGLKYVTKPTVKILEIGFGTGLNAYLTLASLNKEIKCHYHSLEKFPIDIELALQMNYPSLYPIEGGHELFAAMHHHAWNVESVITSSFHLTKIKDDLLKFKTSKLFDVVYFDAFGPDKQPEMWSLDVFKSIFQVVSPGGVLTTYSAKGSVRRNMIAAGFSVERLQGPPGKREMLRAIKPV